MANDSLIFLIKSNENKTWQGEDLNEKKGQRDWQVVQQGRDADKQQQAIRCFCSAGGEYRQKWNVISSACLTGWWEWAPMLAEAQGGMIFTEDK